MQKLECNIVGNPIAVLESGAVRHVKTSYAMSFEATIGLSKNSATSSTRQPLKKHKLEKL